MMHYARSRSFRDAVIAFVVLVLLTLFAAGCVTQLNPGLSPNDEEVHLDYLVKVGQFHLPVAGEKMGQEALRIESCRGFYGPYQPPGLCTAPGPLNPTVFQFNGESRAWFHPPLYYVGTRLVMIPLEVALSSLDFLDKARIAGAMWTAVGLFLLWLSFRRMRVAPDVTWSILLILMVSQPVMQRAMTVTNDGSAFFAGALLFYLLVSKRGGLILALGSCAVMLLKAQSAIAVSTALFAALMGMSTVEEMSSVAVHRIKTLLRVRQALGLVIGFGVGYMLWRIAQPSGTGISTSATDGLVRTAALPSWSNMVPLLYTTAQIFMQPFRQLEFLPSYAIDQRFQYLEYVVNLVFVGAVVGAIMFFRTSRREFVYGASGMFAILIAPILMTLAIALSTSIWAEWPARYGLSALPFLAGGTAVMARGAFGRATVLVLAGASVLLFGAMVL